MSFYAFLIAISAPVLLGQGYNVPSVPRGLWFLEDCDTSIDSIWTQTGFGTAVWEIDGSACNGETNGGSQIPEILANADTYTTSEFCLMKVTEINAALGNVVGCTFRATALAGNHYEAYFDNSSSSARFVPRDNNHDIPDSAWANEISECTTSTTSWVDVDAGDYVGVIMTGTVGGNDISVTWYDFGTTNPGTQPSLWDTWDRTYDCTDAEIDAQTTLELDSPGACGLMSYSVSDTDSNEPNIDDFICGDYF